MKIILHILWKDLRRLRWFLLIWYGLVTLQSLILSSGYDMSMSATKIGAINKLLPGLEVLAFVTLLLVISRLIHEDSLVGTTSFWLTRPISRWSLLAAKSLFVLFVLLLPIIFSDVFILLTNDVTMGDTVVSVASSAYRGKLVLLLAMLTLAAITPSLPRMIVAGVLLVALSVVLWNAGMFVSARLGMWPRPMHLRTSAMVAQSFLAIVFCVAAAVHQFGTRRTARSATLLFSGVGFYAMASMFWPIDLFPVPEFSVEPTVFDSSRVEISLAKRSLRTPFGYRTSRSQQGYVSGELVFSNVQQGYIVRPVSVRSTATFEDGTILTHHPSSQVMQSFYNQLAEDERERLQGEIQRVLGNVHLLNPERIMGYNNLPKLLTLDKSQYQKYRTSPGEFVAEVKAEVLELEVLAEMPVQVGAGHERGSFHFSIIDISPQSGGIAITARHWYPGSSFIERQLDWDHVVLLNRNGKQAVMSRYSRGGWNLPRSPVPYMGSTLVVAHWKFLFTTPDDSEHRIDDSWIRDASLVLIDEVELGTFKKEFEVHGFLMEE